MTNRVAAVYPVTPLQAGMLAATVHSLDGPAYFEQLDFAVPLPLDVARFRQAWERVVERHEALRSVFVWKKVAAPKQVVLADAVLDWRVHDWSATTADEHAARLAGLRAADRDEPFDISLAPPMRVHVIAGPVDGRFHCLWSIHHALLDGWATQIVLDEVMRVYRGGDLEDVAPSMGEFHRWHAGRSIDASAAFWTDYLAGASATPVPVRTTGQRSRDAVARELALPPAVGEALSGVAREAGLTPASVVASLWALLLWKYTGHADVVFGSVTSGRPEELPRLRGAVGMFANTVATRATVVPSQSFATWAAAWQRAEALKRDHLHASIVDVRRWAGWGGHEQLVGTVLTVQNFARGHEARGDLALEDVHAFEKTDVPLALVATIHGDTAWSFRLLFDPALVRAEDVELLALNLGRLAAAVARAPHQRLSLVCIEDTATPATGPARRPARTVVDHFRDQVARDPDALAIADGARVMTYRELDELSAAWAAACRDAGLAPGGALGVCLSPGPEVIVAYLAALRAGCAYVPLDPTDPPARLAELARSAGLQLAIASGEGATSLGAVVEVLSPDRLAAAPARTWCDPVGDVDAPAYVMYTSGSTGVPKGVVVPHRGVVRLVVDTDYVPFGPDRRIAQVCSLLFDAATFEVWGALLNGGAVVFVPRPISPEGLAQVIDAHGVDLACLPTGLFNRLAELAPEVIARLRHCIVAGEVASPRHVAMVERRATGVSIVNGYGPTEVTTFACVGPLRGDAAAPPPVGVAIANTTAHVLDAHLNPVPPGMPGTLYLGGAGVAAGYLNRPDATAAAFVPDPFEPGQRLYATGDLAVRAPDGTLTVLGRVDGQVKVGGFRVEREEIRRQIETLAGVAGCHVRAVDGRLVAYVTPSGIERPAAAMLAAELARRVPGYMVPGAFVWVDQFPLTRNGKLDADRLPAPTVTPPRPTQSRSRWSTVTEELVAVIWSEVLGRADLTPATRFFDLGGNSLHAMTVVGRVAAVLGAKVSVRQLFERPSIADFARAIDSARGERDSEAPVLATAGPAWDDATTSQERRMWFLQALAGDGGVYGVSTALRVPPAVGATAVADALRALTAIHPALRTRFALEGERLVRRVDAAVEPPYRRVRCTESALRDALRAEAARAFDLAGELPWRATAFELDDGQLVLIVTLHHIIVDAWSLTILLGDLACILDGQSRPAPQLALTDVAAWQQLSGTRALFARQLDYWRAQLAAPTPTNLPTDFARPPGTDFAGETASRVLSRAAADAVAALCKRFTVTPFMACAAAFFAVLHRYCDQQDVRVGVPVAARRDSRLERVVGCLSNTVVLRSRVGRDTTFARLLAKVRDDMLGAQEHADLPFEDLVEALVTERDPARTPLFDTMFAAEELREGAFAAVEVPCGAAKFDLSAFVSMTSQDMRLSIEYRTALFRPGTIAQIMSFYERVLVDAAAEPEARLARLGAAREVAVPASLAAAGLFAPAHARFEACARRAPEATALVCASGTRTYAELDADADRVAHLLLARGIAPGERVAICMRRTPALVASILGVAKAGAVYVPLDPDYPAERLAAILATARPALVLVDPRADDGAAVVVGDGIECVEIAPAALPAHPPASSGRSRAPGDVSHVIFTSGSTGTPKGVAISHGAVSELIEWATRSYRADELRCVLASTSVCFDLSVFELFVPLSMGGTVCLVDDALALIDAAPWVREAGITLVNTVPSVALQLVEHDALPATAATINLAGEPLPRELVRRLYARPSVRDVYNLYGPSEDTTYSTVARVPDDDSMPRIGVSLPGSRAVVLDAWLDEVPPGMPGELYLIGSKLARGYEGRPDLTAERFVPAVVGAPGDRMYRTGDRVRVVDGELEFLGRLDRQLKLRGFRIEPEEVQHACERLDRVTRAIVRARPDRAGELQLVAYVVGNVAPAEVRDALRRVLPAYMVPAALVIMEALPVTPNGKIDDSRLPAPCWDDAGDDAELQIATERAVAALWREMLGVEVVSRTADFFALGGHSLRAVSVVARLRERFGVDLSLKAFFVDPTVAAVARLVDAGAPRRRLGPTPRGLTSYPATPLQSAIWAASRRAHDDADVLVWPLRVRGDLDLGELERATRRLVLRHEILRTRFAIAAEGVTAYVVEPDGRELEVVDATAAGVPLADLVSERGGLDLERGPLFRVRAIVCGRRDHVVALQLHHIITDGSSFEPLVAELFELYGRDHGASPELAAPALQFGDYAAWLHETPAAELAGHVEFWRGELAGYRNLGVFDDRGDSRAVIRTLRGPLAPLTDAARRHRVGLFSLLHTALLAALFELTGELDLVVGTAAAGRTTLAAERVNGPTVTVLPLRCRVEPGQSLAAVARDVQAVRERALDRQDYPFEGLVGQLGLAANPIEVGLTLQSQLPDELQPHPSLAFEPVEVPQVRSRHPLWLLCTPSGEDLHIELAFQTHHFDEADMALVVRVFSDTLDRLCADGADAFASRDGDSVAIALDLGS